jgi:endonuclease/exonuclease/phosphatase family metal-dependent hydrolase
MKPLRIRVATYNIHKCRGLDGRTSPERIVSVIRDLRADVVALQEVLHVESGNPKFDQVHHITSGLPEYQAYFGDNRKSHGGAYGNLTLSRFPLKTCANYDVTWRRRERRGCLRTDVELANHATLHLFNVHLGTSFLERRHQARRLLSDEVLNRAEFRGPRIVVGDFNEWTRGLATRMMGKAFEAVEAEAFPRYRRTYPGIFPLLHLDHFYYDRHLRLTRFRLCRNRKTLVASDHLPLLAEFEIAGLSAPFAG